MKYSRQNFFSNTAIALSAFLSFALLACSESNPTNADEPIAYSEPVPESSSALESSSSAEESVSLAQESSSSVAPSSSSSGLELSSSSAPSIESSSSSSEKKIKCYETDGKIGDVCADAYLSYVSQGVHGGITAGPIIVDCYIYTEKGWNKMGGTLEDWWKKMGYSRDSLEGDLLEGELHICKEYAAVYEKCAIEEPITGDTCSYEVDGEVYYYFFMYDVWSKNGYDVWLKNDDDEF